MLEHILSTEIMATIVFTHYFSLQTQAASWLFVCCNSLEAAMTGLSHRAAGHDESLRGRTEGDAGGEVPLYG